jgi:L-ascorbate metabolism protein UlaG (beta-lactamase superfamily)
LSSEVWQNIQRREAEEHSGYDKHFASIGECFGSIDFALLENGQYNKAWKYIHMQPEETLQAARDLRAKNVIPVHNSKFAMSRHNWDEPLQRISEMSDMEADFRLLTPKIGEIVFLKDTAQTFSRWWKEVE